jgi:hypothetical protein
MTGDEAVEQPRVGFSYSFWFKCTQCDSRVEVDSELYELQSTGRAGYSMCTPCGAELDIRRPHVRALRNPEDVAKNNDSVGHLVCITAAGMKAGPTWRPTPLMLPLKQGRPLKNSTCSMRIGALRRSCR